MLKSDSWIRSFGSSGGITPFVPDVVREKADRCKVLSYGTGSYGYDLRLSSREFRIFRHIPGKIVNPKKFNPANLERAELQVDDEGSRYYVLPAHSYGLGVAVERIVMPPNVTAICVGKSTYARCGIIVNVTPAEAGWDGHLTLEFSNSSGADCMVFADEGVCQLLYLEGEPCEVTYSDRNGKYQHQGEEVVTARI